MGFVSPEVTLIEREGEAVDVCVILELLNNETVLMHDINFFVIFTNGPGASKSVSINPTDNFSLWYVYSV